MKARTFSAPRASRATTEEDGQVDPTGKAQQQTRELAGRIVAQAQHHGSVDLTPVPAARPSCSAATQRHPDGPFSQVEQATAVSNMGRLMASAPSACRANEPPSNTSSSWPPTWLT